MSELKLGKPLSYVEENGHETGISRKDIVNKKNRMDTTEVDIKGGHKLIKIFGDIEVSDDHDDDTRRTKRVDYDGAPPAVLQVEFAQKRCWHPVMLESNTNVPIMESGDKEPPHRNIIKNLRKAMELNKEKMAKMNKHPSENEALPNMLLYLCQTSMPMLVEAAAESTPAKTKGRKVPLPI